MKGRERQRDCRKVGRREKGEEQIRRDMCVDFFNYCGDAVEADYRAKVVELCGHRPFLPYFSHQPLMRNGAADYKGSVSTATSKASTTLDIALLDVVTTFMISHLSSKRVDYQHNKPDWRS